MGPTTGFVQLRCWEACTIIHCVLLYFNDGQVSASTGAQLFKINLAGTSSEVSTANHSLLYPTFANMIQIYPNLSVSFGHPWNISTTELQTPSAPRSSNAARAADGSSTSTQDSQAIRSPYINHHTSTIHRTCPQTNHHVLSDCFGMLCHGTQCCNVFAFMGLATWTTGVNSAQNN